MNTCYVMENCKFIRIWRIKWNALFRKSGYIDLHEALWSLIIADENTKMKAIAKMIDELAEEFVIWVSQEWFI